MALLRFDPKKNNYFLEAGWPRKGSIKKNGLALRLVQKGPEGIVLVRDVVHLDYDKDRLGQGVQIRIPELGDLMFSYKKVLGLLPLVVLILNGEKLKGSEVLKSALGEIAYIG